MERHEIETFLVLAEELHFRRTAERLGLSHSRVSQTISTLERRIGAPLFERTSRRVSLTPLGRQLRDGIEPAHRRIEEEFARAVAMGRGFGGLLRLGFMGPATAEVLVRVMKAFRARHPDVEVLLTQETQIGDHLAPLRSGEIDLLATLMPVRESDLVTGPILLREGWVVAVSSNHPFSRLASVSVEDLSRDTLVDAEGAPPYWLDHYIPSSTPSGRPIRRGPSVGTFQAALALVGAGSAIATVNSQAARYYVRPDISYVPLRDVPPAEYGLVWRASAETGRIRAFAQICADVVGQPA
ncbi:LysR family transcriptional regulator [Nonomuraea dietziae]|uniref:LysR family transcriptional regulator n=1 Tax=Nonomuraea dietziae TaxID=65515 RepID=UPI0033E4391A